MLLLHEFQQTFRRVFREFGIVDVPVNDFDVALPSIASNSAVLSRLDVAE